MSDTPETDGAEIIFSPLEGDAWVPASISRKLERERDEAREIAQQLINVASHCCGSDREDRWWLLLSRQVKEACDRFGAATQERRHVVPTEWAEQLEIERDEAREALKHITEYGTEEINAAVELRQKLAQALVDLDNMQDQRDLAMKVIKRLEQERDEAREDATNYYARIIELEEELNEAKKAFK